jgi:hypothetical protein
MLQRHQREFLRPQSQTRLPFIDIYIRITTNINEHAIIPLATLAPFAELGVFVCVLLGAMLVCVPDMDPLFPVLVTIAVEVVAELEVDATAELEVDSAAELEVDTTAEFDGLIDANAELGTAPTAVGSTKPQVGAAGPAVALTHTSITH